MTTMGNKRGKAKAGTLMSFETGSYSDYGVVGFFVVLNGFDSQEALDEFFAVDPQYIKDGRIDSDAFLAFLIRKGYLLEIKYGVMHMDYYFVTDKDDLSFVPVKE